MSTKSSLEIMKQKIQQKNLVVVTGNTFDLFIQDKNNGNQLTTVDVISKHLLETMNFSVVNVFNPSKGFYNYKTEEIIHPSEMVHKSLVKSIDYAIEEIENWKATNEYTASYIFEFTDMLLDKVESDLKLFNSLTKLLSIILNPTSQKVSAFTIQKQPKVIFVQRDSNIINKFIKAGNSEYANVEILKPNIEERREFFKKFGNKFDVLDRQEIRDVETKQHAEAVALTDKMNFKEMLQLSRINIEDEEYTFKELYTYSQSSKKESEWTKLSKENVSSMADNFKSSLFGQDYAIEAVQNTIIRSFMGMTGAFHSSNASKPKGALFFAGPTGTGKTQLAKMLATEIFGDESKMIRFDMSEYNHPESDAKLIGSAPGYVGHGSGGQLTNKIKENPFSIILFDEIEKADPSIMDKFLQILEDGRLTSGQGELVDFSETFIIFTSNIGQKEASISNPEAKNRDIFRNGVKSHFKDEIGRPELLNRIGEDNIIPFNFITDFDIIMKLVKSKIKLFNSKLKKDKNIIVNIDDKTIKSLTRIISDKTDKKMGGRGIMTTLELEYGDVVTRFLFHNYENLPKDNESKHILIDSKGDKISINFK